MMLLFKFFTNIVHKSFLNNMMMNFKVNLMMMMITLLGRKTGMSGNGDSY